MKKGWVLDYNLEDWNIPKSNQPLVIFPNMGTPWKKRYIPVTVLTGEEVEELKEILKGSLRHQRAMEILEGDK